MPAIDFGGAFEAHLRPIQIGLRGPVGSGKTADMIDAIKTVLASSPDATCAVFVPNHKLADEFAARLRTALAAGATVEVWRGQDQPDPGAPTGAPRRMCERGDVVRQVREAGGAIEDVCGSKRRGYCHHHPDAGGACGYVAQRRTKAQVWVMPHAMLHRPAPENMRRALAPPADITIIDECFTSAMLGGFGTRPVKFAPAALGASCFATVPDTGNIPGLNTKRLGDTLNTLAGALGTALPGGCISRESLDASGLGEHAFHEARRLALLCKKPIPRAGLPAAAISVLPTVLGSAAADNRTVLDVAQFLRVAADVASGRIGPAGLRMGVGSAAGSVVLKWREDIHADWLAAPVIIHADATMNETTVKQWLPDLHAPAVAPVSAPHMRVVQIEDRSLGYTSIVPSKGGAQTTAAKAIQGNVARLLETIAELGRRYAGTGCPGVPDVVAILPKDLETALAAPGGVIPANVGVEHFGNLRGLDAYKNVGALLVVSRPLPPPSVVEDEAEIIFGPGIKRLVPSDFYPKRSAHLTMTGGAQHPIGGGGRYYHPDPRAEAVRWSHCEAELIQAAGRGRGTLRTASKPLDVLILTHTPLDGVEVTEACTLDTVWLELGRDDLVRPMLEAGVLPDDWAGIGAVLTASGRLRGAGNAGDVARKCFARDQSMTTALTQARKAVSGANNGRNSYISNLRETSVIRAIGGWTAFACRRPGQRKSARVLIAPWHTDPRAVAERVLGPLDAFMPAGQPIRRARVTRSQTARVPCAVLPLAAGAPGLVQDGSAPAPATVCAPSASGPSAATCDALAGPPAQAPPTPDGLAIPTGAPVGIAPDLEARIASVQLGLPSVLAALQAAGKITKADRQRILDWFRRTTGSRLDREHEVLLKLAGHVGPRALQAAARHAALAALGETRQAPL